MRRAAFVMPLLAAFLPAQDMIGVTFAGQVLRMNSVTGATTVLANGAAGKNCLCCTGNNRLISAIRTGGLGTGFRHHLIEIDPFTGAETILFGQADFGDLRGMTAAPGQPPDVVLAVRDTGGPDELVVIDLATGVLTVIGATGFSSIQALDVTGSGLRAWDLGAGLLNISGSTGAATDPFPAVGGPTGQQFLVTNPVTFATFVGNTQMRPLTISVGVAGLPINFAGAPDLRGAVFTTERTQRFGSDCGGIGGESNVFALSAIRVGQPLTIRSTRHGAGAFGAMVLGFSQTSHGGQPLPFLLDPLLGTVGCRLNVSLDASLLAFADPAGTLDVTLPLPAAARFFQFFVQHAAFDPVPGGMTWTDGLRVRAAL
ncbi:MAG: hypothetical protein IPK26_04850 [Planctomycetes bacterium]|nr:hypothetical protein [Planctomycetota bacterium]